MQGNDLSNQVAPAIVIDVDLLVEETRKWYGLKKRSLREGVLPLLDRLFSRDLGIYIVCWRESESEADAIEKFLEDYYVSFTRFYHVTSHSDLYNIVMGQGNVIRLYLSDEYVRRTSIRYAGKMKVIHTLEELEGDLYGY